MLSSPVDLACKRTTDPHPNKIPKTHRSIIRMPHAYPRTRDYQSSSKATGPLDKIYACRSGENKSDHHGSFVASLHMFLTITAPFASSRLIYPVSGVLRRITLDNLADGPHQPCQNPHANAKELAVSEPEQGPFLIASNVLSVQHGLAVRVSPLPEWIPQSALTCRLNILSPTQLRYANTSIH